ncbi:hypothetical protein [Peribacillus frigoritolerans]|uniref:Uncharacterized protein n=1 Tax=Peribacillus frigoritolerans TaxID=450367 RepID=A0AAJ1QLB7_9BACI|nr:hypothetical protein [Peribacillus frigoritolerans]MDM5283114.1 hypothetical protein [Peribacillus frigoritolerans]
MRNHAKEDIEFEKEMNETINKLYADVLGVPVDVSKMSFKEQERLNKLYFRQLEVINNDAKREFANLSPKEQKRRNLEARLAELKLEDLQKQLNEM